MNGTLRPYLLWSIALIALLPAYGQQGFYLDWAFPHTLSTPISPAIAPDGSIWLTGKYYNPYSDLNRHPDTTAYLPATRNFTQDGYLVRLDSTGWYKETLTLAGKGADEVVFTGFDAAGGMTLLGKASDSLNLSFGSTPYYIAPTESSYFLARYSPDRELLWVHTWPVLNWYVQDCKVGPDGSFYFAGGLTGGTSFDADFTATIDLIPALPNGHLVLARYRPDGSRAWAHAFDRKSSSGNLYELAVTDSTLWAGGRFYAFFVGADSAQIADKKMAITNGAGTPFLAQIGPNGAVAQFFDPLGQSNYVAGMLTPGPGGSVYVGLDQQPGSINYVQQYGANGQKIREFRMTGGDLYGLRYQSTNQRLYALGPVNTFVLPDTTLSAGASFPGTQRHLWELDTTGFPLAGKQGERVKALHTGFGQLYFTGDFAYSTTLDDLTPPFTLQLNTSTTTYPFVGRCVSYCTPATYTTQPIDTLRNCENTVKIDLKATGTGLRYAWYAEDDIMEDYIGGGGGTSIQITGTRSPWMRYSISTTTGLYGFNSGNYHCKLYDGCATPVQNSDTTWRFLYGSPYYEGAKDALTVNAGDTLRYFLNTPSYPMETLRYQWLKGNFALFDGGRFSGTSTATLQITGAKPTDAGLYYCITYNQYCTGFYPAYALTVTVNGTTSMEAPSPTLSLFPNPARDRVFVETDGLLPESAYLIAPDGRNYLLDLQEEGQFWVLNLPQVPAGVYGIQLVGENGVKTGKILID